MKAFSFHTIYMYICLALLVTAGLTASCQDELYQELDYTTVGKEVVLTIPVKMPAMEVKTRGDIAVSDRDGIKSLWIAVFDATTGEITSKKADNTANGWYKVTNISTDYTAYQEEPDGKFGTVTLSAKSGPSYIVAVANVDNMGVTSDAQDEPKQLSELLTDDLTWEGFNKIAVVSFPEGNAQGDIYAPNIENGLPMSGCYSSLALGGIHSADWAATNFTQVFIPSSGTGNVNLTDGGAIHLRRLVSHITFNLEAAGDVIDLSVEGYRIFNVPNYSWLYERGNNANGTGSNFGDQATQDNATTYYHAPVRFGEHYVTTDNTKHSFDFWMVENKHTGNITPAEDENASEEVKQKDAYNQREAKTIQGNDVLYTALTGNAWTANNMASYVVIRCNVTYKEQVNVDEDGLNDTDKEKTEVYRTGVAEYTIHLGYINNDAGDFNSYRNTNYTYNVKVNGLNEIVVEANDGGTRNSAEGIVTDVENRTVLLDAHYSCFNVVFTEEELSNLETTDGSGHTIATFGYIVTTYESGVAHTYTEADDAVTGDDRKYIDWIELKPTTDATTLAIYKPASRGTYTAPANPAEGDEPVMPIDEFYRTVKNNQDNLGQVFTKNADGNYYFTVFINEYTYEPRYGDANWGDETTTDVWYTYVNQPSRHFYFRVRRQTSEDGNSVYARSKYAIEQQSIQTYYSNRNEGEGDASTAIGIEHVNEVQGLNLRKNFTNTEISHVNGRWNVHRWLTNNDANTSSVNWDDFVQRTVMLQIPNANNFISNQDELLQGGPQLVSIESGWNPADLEHPTQTGYGNLPALATFNGSIYSSLYDPQKSSTNKAHFIEAINACMNRNRDENGDGSINKEELKWYVPASGKYLRAILGRNSLTDPIMPYQRVSKLPSNDNGENSRWLMYASDDKVAWAMEGLSMSDWVDRDDGKRIPWNVRCIRNLGTNLQTTVNSEKVTMAYVHDEANRKVRMTYYDNASIRTEKITGKGNGNTGGGMPMHPVTDPLNKVYYAFEYSSTMVGPVTNVYPNQIAANFINTNTGNPCYRMEGDGWRLPNQKELAIMRNCGLFDSMPDKTNSSNQRDCYGVSCTYDYFTTAGEGTAQGTPSYTLNNGVPNHRLMVTRNDGGTRLPESNSVYYHLYYRCVRDVEP